VKKEKYGEGYPKYCVEKVDTFPAGYRITENVYDIVAIAFQH
jgi:hypothetical protein